jgi:hypothetical protein
MDFQLSCSVSPMMKALGTTQEAGPEDVLVLRDLAHEFGTVAAQAGNERPH